MNLFNFISAVSHLTEVKTKADPVENELTCTPDKPVRVRLSNNEIFEIAEFAYPLESPSQEFEEKTQFIIVKKGFLHLQNSSHTQLIDGENSIIISLGQVLIIQKSNS